MKLNEYLAGFKKFFEIIVQTGGDLKNTTMIWKEKRNG